MKVASDLKSGSSWARLVFGVMITISVLTYQSRPQPTGRLSIKVYRGPNREVQGRSYAPWGYYVQMPSGQEPSTESTVQVLEKPAKTNKQPEKLTKPPSKRSKRTFMTLDLDKL